MQYNSHRYRKTCITTVMVVRQTGQVPASAATLFAHPYQKRACPQGTKVKLGSFLFPCLPQCCRRCGSCRRCCSRQLRRVVVVVAAVVVLSRLQRSMFPAWSLGRRSLHTLLLPLASRPWLHARTAFHEAALYSRQDGLL